VRREGQQGRRARRMRRGLMAQWGEGMAGGNVVEREEHQVGFSWCWSCMDNGSDVDKDPGVVLVLCG
jgi:hypothetical protein